MLPFSKDKSEVQLDIDFIRSTIKEAEMTIQNCFGNNFAFEEAPNLSKGEEESLGEQFLAFQEKEEELKKAKEAFQSLLQTMQGLSRELQEKRQELESERVVWPFRRGRWKTKAFVWTIWKILRSVMRASEMRFASV